jgi:hypothetical protein
VNQDRYCAKVPSRLREQLFRAAFRGEVSGNKPCVMTFTAELISHFLAGVGMHVGENDARAFSGQRNCDATPDAGSGTGDQCSVTLQ